MNKAFTSDFHFISFSYLWARYGQNIQAQLLDVGPLMVWLPAGSGNWFLSLAILPLAVPPT